jgi:hypothetical protein
MAKDDTREVRVAAVRGCEERREVERFIFAEKR